MQSGNSSKRRKVLVTGADGFIGSHLVEALVLRGLEVRAFCYYNSFNSWGWLDTVDKAIIDQVEIFMGDIRDPNGVRSAVKGVDEVFHLAALIGIPFSYHSPDSYIDTNIKGTLNVLQACRDQSVDRILVTSTSEVYGTAKVVPISEDHIRQPQSPYSASKVGADSVSESFFRSFDLPVTIVRPFNTYGPRQSARAIVPTIITQLLDGSPKIKIGDSSPTRDLVYVADTVSGFIGISECSSLIGEDVNIATGVETSIAEVVNMIINRVNPAAVIESDKDRIRPEKSEVFRLLGDNTKLLSATEWRPEVDLADGLDRTIDWFKQEGNRSSYKSGIFNI